MKIAEDFTIKSDQMLDICSLNGSDVSDRDLWMGNKRWGERAQNASRA